MVRLRCGIRYNSLIMGSIGMDQPRAPYAVEVDVLIVGAGPTGAALACFLGSHGMVYETIGLDRNADVDHPGITGMMVSDAPCASDTPRANYTNMAAFGEVTQQL